MEKLSHPYGVSSQTESNWPNDALSEAHSRFILSYMKQEQQREQEVMDQFLAQKGQPNLSLYQTL
jgi:hypothetical protein